MVFRSSASLSKSITSMNSLVTLELVDTEFSDSPEPSYESIPLTLAADLALASSVHSPVSGWHFADGSLHLQIGRHPSKAPHVPAGHNSSHL